MRIAISIGRVILFDLELQLFTVDDPEPPIRITLEQHDEPNGDDDNRIL